MQAHAAATKIFHRPSWVSGLPNIKARGLRSIVVAEKPQAARRGGYFPHASSKFIKRRRVLIHDPIHIDQRGFGRFESAVCLLERDRRCLHCFARRIRRLLEISLSGRQLSVEVRRSIC